MSEPGPADENEPHDDATRRDDARRRDATERRDLRRALMFGVVLATIEMAVVLALLYC